ncbi:MAG TPA: LURP-one-related family protein [Thermotogota bacterium]|nr:LURP-one-related family protein [Thermotogota bacterium]HRW92316.1 LURP-one-related family protein [Thermotogota bacterium]
MMRYKIREKIFSFADRFTIKNEMDEPCYTVRGKVFSFGNKLFLEDLQGNELVYIEQKLFRWLPEYHLFRNGQEMAMVKRKFSFFRPKFEIFSELGDFTVEGNFWAHEFSILQNGLTVASISKKWFSFSDSYGVEIANTEQTELLLALTIVLDQVLYDRRGSSSSSN